MLKENEQVLEEFNVTKWWSAGYTGENVNILILDLNGKLLDEMKPYATLIDPDKKIVNQVKHNTFTTQIAHEFAPKANIYVAPWTFSSKSIIEWVKNNPNLIDIVNVSLATPRSNDFDIFKELDIPLCASSGNGGDKNRIGVDFPADLDWTISVGAYNWENKGVYSHDVTDYSNGGEMLDCVATTNIYVKNEDGSIRKYDGTSTSSPALVGMLACYIQYRKENGLGKLTIKDAKEFIKANCVDIKAKGFDYESGNGLFELPFEIPKIEVKPTPIPTVIKASIEPVKTSNPAIVTPETYIVKAGNSLSGISKKYGVSIDDIKKWNNLSSNSIKVGQKLVLKQPLKQTFKDIPPSHSAYKEIEEVYKLGLIDGFGDNFKPNDTITRAELAKIIYGIVKGK